MRRLLLILRDPGAAAGVLWLGLLIAAALAAPWIAPHDPLKVDLLGVLQPPGPEHWLGTDDLGRDVLSRLLYGAAPSLFSSIGAVALGMLIGLPFGLIAGYLGGWVDAAISRGIDALLSFPTILLAVGIAAVLGTSLTNAVIAIGIAFSPGFARLARARTLAVKQELYVDAARAAGAGAGWLLTRHVLPNAVTPVIVQAGLLLGTALLAEASLSFLGLGVQPPQASWGGMLARALLYLERAPDLMIAPGVALLLTALAFNSLGETARRWLDPR
ncbi:ABC transporter permease [Roseomonas sp. AR75]|jgi:peptide/nickel transport system permease protein|uniref:ABC transporter permease n=1 Tax=Roseomonas sp. AR75 TaxID=2562311 RepID=UPI0010BFDE61|nr:ABC transporter permease [Roseomonas sp. AR75]